MSETREIAGPQEKLQEQQESTAVQDRPEGKQDKKTGEQRMDGEGNGKAALLAPFAEIYAQLDPQEVEEFYTGYQVWKLQQRATILEKQIEILREHLRENSERIEQSRPSAVALAVLARLQANGVNDVAVLDRMLDRGEEWLDKTMQHLDYCEQVEDFIQGDYTQWCRHALEGAYDWIDSMLEAGEASSESTPAASAEEAAEIKATEEILLQKLSSDDEAAMLEITLKRPAFKLRRRDTQPLQEEMTQRIEGAGAVVQADAVNAGDTDQAQGRRNTRPLAGEAETEPVAGEGPVTMANSEAEDVEAIEEMPASEVEDSQTSEEMPAGDLHDVQEANVEIESVGDEAQEAEAQGEDGQEPGDEVEALGSVIERDREDQDAGEAARGTEEEASIQGVVEAQVEPIGEGISLAEAYVPVEAQRIEFEVTPASEEEGLVKPEEDRDGEISRGVVAEEMEILEQAEGVEAAPVQEEMIEYWEEEDAVPKGSGGEGNDVEITWWVEPAAQADNPGAQVVQPEVSVPVAGRRRVGFWRWLLGWFWRT